jgi:hypothetical protein
VRRLLLLALVVVAVLWIVRDRPTVTGLVDRITNPLLHSKAAVEESEHNRVVAEAAPAVGQNQEVLIGMLKEGMTIWEIRDLLGRPDSATEEVRNGKTRQRWYYRRIRRMLVLEDDRVVSIAIQ